MQRIRFDEAVIADVQANDGWDMIRVYPSRRIKLQPPRRIAADPKVRVTRNSAGAVVGLDVVDGAARIWVTFEPSCDAPHCAFPFIEDDEGTFTFAGDPDTKLDVKRRPSRIRYDQHRLEHALTTAPPARR